MKISEGCPQYFRSMSNENIRGLSTIFSECVQCKMLEGGPTLLSKYVQ